MISLTLISTPRLRHDSRKYWHSACGPSGLLLSSSLRLTSAFMRVVRWVSGRAARLVTLVTMVSMATDSSSSSFCTSVRLSKERFSGSAGLPISYWLSRANDSKICCRKPRSILRRFMRRSRMASKKAFCSALLVARSAISNRESSALSSRTCSAWRSCWAALSRTLMSATGSRPAGEAGFSGTAFRCTTFASVRIETLSLRSAAVGNRQRLACR